MKDALEYAKYFIRQNPEHYSNTLEGNKKLNKLLIFADMINLAQFDEPLFANKIMAFENGFVVEDIRQKYKNNHNELICKCLTEPPELSENEQISLQYADEIFGKLSADQLSELSHTFSFWSEAYNRGTYGPNYHNKERSVINLEEMMAEVPKIKMLIEVYKKTSKEDSESEIINGIVYHYNPDEIQMTEDIICYLQEFSEQAEDTSYSVYRDNGELVVF